VRIASWIFVACAVVVLVAVFVPSIAVEVHGFTPRKASLSLYKISTDRGIARALFGRYSHSQGRKVGEALTAALVPRMGSNKVHLDDAQDAMSTLDELSDEDVKHAGWAIMGAVWALILLSIVMAGLVIGELVRPEVRTRRTIVAAVLSLVVAALGVGAHLGCGEAVFQANDEIGRDLLALAVGAYLLPVAAVVAFGAIVTANVLARRGRAAPTSR
jgi:hypothetical protein